MNYNNILQRSLCIFRSNYVQLSILFPSRFHGVTKIRIRFYKYLLFKNTCLPRQLFKLLLLLLLHKYNNKLNHIDFIFKKARRKHSLKHNVLLKNKDPSISKIFFLKNFVYVSVLQSLSLGTTRF